MHSCPNCGSDIPVPSAYHQGPGGRGLQHDEECQSCGALLTIAEGASEYDLDESAIRRREGEADAW